MIDNAIYTEDRKVVVRYAQPIPKLLKVGGVQVYFEIRHGVSLAFVEESQVPSMLAYQGGCCGGKKFMISLASQAVYDHWLEGNGGR